MTALRVITGRGEGAARQDAELVHRVRSGDVDAFSELYRLHAGAVLAAVRDNVRDPDGAADAVQEAFTRALARLETLREPDRFRPWLLSIARHAAVDSRRFSTRVTALSDDDADALPSRHQAPPDHAELRDLAGLLEAGTATLPVRDATALSLVTHLGFGPTEVAAALGVTVGAAKVIVHRARRRLRDAIALHVLVRAKAEACATFRARCEADDMVGAARHLKTCHDCADAADREVAHYDTALVAAAR
jgi:RNA polymerase sigma-70 factor (ECF subfamily)